MSVETVDHKSLVSSTKEAVEMSDLGQNTDQPKKKPSYYEGVYMNDRTISTSGDVTPSLLRSPISRGLFHLPRYVPKYTVNSRLCANYAGDTFSESKTSRTLDRKFKDGKGSDSHDFITGVPIYRERSDGVETSSGEKKETRKNKGWKKSKEKAESEESTACCSECCSSKCCTCTSKCRRCACIIFVVVALVAAALLALALGLYFGYFTQFGDSYPMKANFTVTNATFRDYLSNLSNPNTINLTNGICQAFITTLENVSQISVDLSSCSAVAYTSGSVNALFNIDVRHRRDQFTNSGEAFVNSIGDRVRAEFRPDPTGFFAAAVSNSILSDYRTGVHFNLVLNDISSGHFSPPSAPTAFTVAARSARTNSITTKSTSAIVTTPKNIAISTRNSAGANTNGYGGNAAVSPGDNSTSSGYDNNTGVTTTSGSSSSSTNTTPGVSANNCGNNTGVNPNANGTNCDNTTSKTADNALSTTITSIAMNTTEPGQTSGVNVSIRIDSSTTIKPLSTNAAQSSSTQNPTTQSLSTHRSTIHSSSTRSPTTQPSSTHSPTTPPTSIVRVPTSASAHHPEVTTTATPSAITPARKKK